MKQCSLYTGILFLTMQTQAIAMELSLYRIAPLQESLKDNNQPELETIAFLNDMLVEQSIILLPDRDKTTMEESNHLVENELVEAKKLIAALSQKIKLLEAEKKAHGNQQETAARLTRVQELAQNNYHGNNGHAENDADWVRIVMRYLLFSLKPVSLHVCYLFSLEILLLQRMYRRLSNILDFK